MSSRRGQGLGIIAQGGLTPTVLRVGPRAVLGTMADVFVRLARAPPRSRHPPPGAGALSTFPRGKRRLRVLERHAERHSIRSIQGPRLCPARRSVRIEGQDTVAAQASSCPSWCWRRWRDSRWGETPSASRRAPPTRRGRCGSPQSPLPKRPPPSAQADPERPVFSALKIAHRRLGENARGADIGCHAFAHAGRPSTRAIPSSATASVLRRQRGGAELRHGVVVHLHLATAAFWHSGLTTGVANADLHKRTPCVVTNPG